MSLTLIHWGSDVASMEAYAIIKCRLSAGESAKGNHVSTCIGTLAIFAETNGLPTSEKSWASVGLPWITDVPTPIHVRFSKSAASANYGIVCWVHMQKIGAHGTCIFFFFTPLIAVVFSCCVFFGCFVEISTYNLLNSTEVSKTCEKLDVKNLSLSFPLIFTQTSFFFPATSKTLSCNL